MDRWIDGCMDAWMDRWIGRDVATGNGSSTKLTDSL